MSSRTPQDDKAPYPNAEEEPSVVSESTSMTQVTTDPDTPRAHFGDAEKETSLPPRAQAIDDVVDWEGAGDPQKPMNCMYDDPTTPT